MFTMLIVVIASWVYTSVKMHQTAYFKYVQFIVYQKYLNKQGKQREKATNIIKDRHLILDTQSVCMSVWSSLWLSRCQCWVFIQHTLPSLSTKVIGKLSVGNEL